MFLLTTTLVISMWHGRSMHSTECYLVQLSFFINKYTEHLVLW